MKTDYDFDDSYDEPYFDDDLLFSDEAELRQQERHAKKQKAQLKKRRTQEKLYQLQEQRRFKLENDYLDDDWDRTH